MRKMLIAAGLAGLAYYLKRNPGVVNDLKAKATDALNKVKAKANHYQADNTGQQP
jgi:hypothetical protein